MKRAGLVLFIFIVISATATGQESGENNLFLNWQKSMEEYSIPGIPFFFVKKVDSNWIGIGFMLNSPGSLEEDSFLREILQDFPLFQFALLVQGRKLSATIIISYEQNTDWHKQSPCLKEGEADQ